MSFALHFHYANVGRSSIIISFLFAGVICILQGCEVQVGSVESPVNSTQDLPDSPLKRALVYTETQGYRHDVIDKAYNALKGEATKRGWQLTRSENHFTNEKLSTYSVVVFFFTTGDGSPGILSSGEKSALESYIAGGGGFVGVHSAADTYQTKWPFYNQLLGAGFASHPHIQEATVRFENRMHPSTKHFKSDQWVLTDEWYNYAFASRSALTVLATLDESTYSGGKHGNDHPIIWCHEYKGGRSWYTGLGHVASNWDDLDFVLHIFGGMDWAGSS